MILEITTTGVHSDIIHTPAPVLHAPQIDNEINHWVQLIGAKFWFDASFRLLHRNINRIETDYSTRAGRRVVRYQFPINLSSARHDRWRIGFIQNVVSRKSIATWNGVDHALTDRTNRVFLDATDSNNLPFYSSPYVDEDAMRIQNSIRINSVSGGGDPLEEESRRMIRAGDEFLVYPNLTLVRIPFEHIVNPWQEQLPRQNESARYSYKIMDIPWEKIPIYCNGLHLDRFRLAQSQQIFFALSKNNRPFEPLFATDIFTTYAQVSATRLSRGLLSGNSNSSSLSNSYSTLVPWQEEVENFPNLAESDVDRWIERQWNQKRGQRPRESSVYFGTMPQLARLDINRNMITEGELANDTTIGVQNPQCVSDFIERNRS